MIGKPFKEMPIRPDLINLLLKTWSRDQMCMIIQEYTGDTVPKHAKIHDIAEYLVYNLQIFDLEETPIVVVEETHTDETIIEDLLSMSFEPTLNNVLQTLSI